MDSYRPSPCADDDDEASVGVSANSQLVVRCHSHTSSTLPAFSLQLGHGQSFHSLAIAPGLQVQDLFKAMATGHHLDLSQALSPAKESQESSEFRQKIERLQSEVQELRKQRAEDGKANERLLSIFASKEQAWKSEKRKLAIDQRKLLQQLHKSFIQQEALRLTVERLRNLSCPHCKEKEKLVSELKERLCEQEILSMASMEEAQAEQHQKKTIADKLQHAEACISGLQAKLSEEEEARVTELLRHRAAVEQLELQLRAAETEKCQALQNFESIQSSYTALIHEKNQNELILAKMSLDMDRLRKSSEDKDDIISAMLKKASIDAEDRHGLEQELSILNAKHRHIEKEREKWRRLFVDENRRSFSTRSMTRNSFGGRADSGTLDVLAELQNLHQIEIRNLQSAFEEEVRVLQERLSMYRDRVADLEEEILVHISADNKPMITYDEHDEGDLKNNTCMTVLKDSLEAELATMQFKLSSSKALIKQYKDTETHRKQEAERWKNLYLTSRSSTQVLRKEQDLQGKKYKNPKWQDWLELEKARHASKLEQRHWQEITAFERQMKARDERMEAFRWQLLKMEDEAHRRTHEINSLKERLARALDDRSRFEELLKQCKEELQIQRETITMSISGCASKDSFQQKLQSLEERVCALQNLLTEKENEFQRTLTEVRAELETELHDKDCKLSVAEAQLLQAHFICDQGRKEKERLLIEFSREKSGLERLLDVGTDTEQDLHDVHHHLCIALENMCTRITEAQSQVSSHRDKIDDERVKELFKQFIQQSNFSFEVGIEEN